tara:strand:- start:1462 stop:1872 length:411 start_codon:yes stop_codon:yes gene_type:complete
MRISNAAAIVALNAMNALADNGGYIKVWSGSAPGTCADLDAGSLLATLTLSVDAFSTATDGGGYATAQAQVIGADVSADAGGDPGHFRVYGANDECILQGSAGDSTSGAELVFDATTINLGESVNIVNLTITLPEA